jgi:hypothetical protein
MFLFALLVFLSLHEKYMLQVLVQGGEKNIEQIWLSKL